jgi:AcrR family transcriptional regulator
MGIQERKEREKENIKQMIANAARELFIENGIESVSMRKIADKIEYSPTTLYNYYANKTDILKTLVEDYFKEYALEAEKHLADTSRDPIENLKAYMKLSVHRAIGNPGMYRLMSSLFSESAHVKFGISGAGKGYNNLKELCQRCINTHKIPKGNIDIQTQALWAVTHGLSSLFANRPSFNWENLEELMDTAISAVIKGL